MNIICDLDGTIALDTGRSKWLHGLACQKFEQPLNHDLECTCGPGERDWEKYFSLCGTDTPNPAVKTILSTMHLSADIWILSGRSMAVSKETVDWIHEHHIPFKYLHMRSISDRTDDHILKLGWAKEFGLTPENTMFVLEDRTRVVDAWRKAGFTCFQVAPGSF